MLGPRSCSAVLRTLTNCTARKNPGGVEFTLPGGQTGSETQAQVPSTSTPPSVAGDKTVKVIKHDRFVILATGPRGRRNVPQNWCAPKYYDEAQVGVALEQLLQEPQNGGAIRREDIFVQTKFTSVDGQDPARVPYDRQASLPDQVRQSMARSLANLRIDFVDSLVLHGPMRTLDENRLVWRTFEELHAAGKTKRIGLSNCYDLRLLRTLYDEAHIRPAVLQNRFHAETGYDRDIRDFVHRTALCTSHFGHCTVIRDIAKKRGITPEQLFYRFTIDIGITPLSGTTNTAHMAHDVLVPDMPPLSAEEIGQIESILYYGQGKKS
uniref:NADP-dependent oxidoreductase domain-containing protein n=1 Tax=Globodera rostochiensis TaxID=31243 RepID=A0A914ID83_GLORO